MPTPIPSPSPSPTPTPEPTPDLRIVKDGIPVTGGNFFDTFADPDTGYTMDYWVFLPENAQQDLPLVVFLHGDGNIGEPDTLPESGIVQQARSLYENDFPFVLLVPNTRVASWEDWPIPDTLLSLIDHTVREYQCNADRVVITGHSRGAIAVWYLICNHPELFSCAIPVSCSNDMLFYADIAAPVPIRAFVGSEYDDYENYGRAMQGLVENVNLYGGDATLTILEGCHHGETSWQAYTRDVFDWMVSQINHHRK